MLRMKQVNILWLQVRKIVTKTVHDVPSPPGLPILGHTLKLMDRNYLQNMAANYRALNDTYGDLVRLKILSADPFLILFDPEDIQAVYKGDGKQPFAFGFDPIHHYRRTMRRDLFPITGGLIGEQKEGWFRVRSVVQQDMLRPQSAFYYIDELQNISQEFAELLGQKLDSEMTLPQNSLSLIHLWALESIASIFLNQRLHTMHEDSEDQDSKALTNAVNVVTELLLKLMFALPTWKFLPWAVPWYRKLDSGMEMINQLTSKKVEFAAQKILAEKKAAEAKGTEVPYRDKCMLEKLIDRSPNGDLTTAKVMAQDGLLAGIDTTGNTAAFLLYNLAIHPEVQAKLVQEIDQVIGIDPKKCRITEKHFNQMPYLRACFQESLRLTPTIIGISRKTSVPMVLSGYDIPPESYVMIPYMTMGHNEKHFKDPMQFKPERWIRGHPDQHSAHPFAFMQFSHGPRMCIGRRFATLEVCILAIKLLQNFHLDYDLDKWGPVNVQVAFVNRPDKELRLKLFPRTIK
uniref:Cytochrome P450 3077A1 n=1 Tax=Paracyclopina nana TaxID=565004 RepID=A0A0F7DGY5_PARNA|nr:cytochrome P450 3077A1 [Paracyclopina nana]